MSQYAAKPFWWRPKDSIIVGDSNPENYSRLGDCIIVPIDCIAYPYPRSLMESTARQNGVEIQKTFPALPFPDDEFEVELRTSGETS